MKKRFTIALVLSLCMSFLALGCGGGGDSDCDGTTIVNEDSAAVTVSQNSLSGITFSSFTLEPDASSKICGNDTDDLMIDVEWSDGSTESKGVTWSGWNGYMCITSSSIQTGLTQAECS